LQNATLNKGRGKHRKYQPSVFTEHGAIMVSAVLKTKIAIKASIQIAEAFISLRELLATHKDLARKLEELEKKYDSQFKVVFDAIRALMDRPVVAPAHPDHDRSRKSKVSQPGPGNRVDPPARVREKEGFDVCIISRRFGG